MQRRKISQNCAMAVLSLGICIVVSSCGQNADSMLGPSNSSFRVISASTEDGIDLESVDGVRDPGGNITPDPVDGVRDPGGNIEPDPVDGVRDPGGNIDPDPVDGVRDPGGNIDPEPVDGVRDPGGNIDSDDDF